MKFWLFLGRICLVMFAASGIAVAEAPQDTAENIDITELKQNIQSLINGIPEAERPKRYSHEKKAYAPLQANEITDGVISDYIEIIKFIGSRKELASNIRGPLNPHSASLYHLRGRKASRIIYHHKAYHSFETNGYATFPRYEEKVVRFHKDCLGECAKTLLEDYADSVVYVSIHPETRDIMPESIREFRKGTNCKEKLSDGPSYKPTSHSLPALGLCIITTEPKNPLDLIKSDGLHIYDTMSSPFWPEELESDYVAMGPASSRPPRAFENLKHVRASGNITHKAMGIKIGTVPEDLTIRYEHMCISVTPSLPNEAIKQLVMETLGKKSLNRNYGKPIILEDGSICHGKLPEKDQRGFFKYWDTVNGKLDFASILTPKQIEENLRASVIHAQSKDEDADAEWASIAEAIDYLQQHHPGFENDIAHRIAPILIEIANYDLTIAHRAPHKILTKMPHKSMEPYLKDLISIFDKTITSLGCVDMKCPKELRGHKPILWHLAEIFSGAGPEAADFLDELQLANEEAGGSMGASWFTIGGGYKAAACIGEMGPVMEKWISSRAYRTTGRDNKVSLDGVLSLRMTGQNKKARKHLETLLDSLSERVKDPSLKPSWAKTRGLYHSIKSTKVALLNWDNSIPYCPARGDR